MKKKANILFSCYACEPLKGSESGVGWNVPYHVAQSCPHYEVFLLTKESKKENIEHYLKRNPLPNFHPLYYSLPQWLITKRFGFGEQLNYLLWEWLACKRINFFDEKLHFDLIHHVTFNQYRTPSPGFFLDKPFVMGPVGGAEIIHPVFYHDLSSSTIKKEVYRAKGKDFKLFRWLNKRSNNKKLLLFSSIENERRLKPFCGNAMTRVLPAISFDEGDFPNIEKDKKNIFTDSPLFEMIYAGRPLDWKGLYIFLKAARLAFINNEIKCFRIKLIGIRNESEQKMVKKWVEEQQLINNVELISFMTRTKLLKTLQTCNLFVYPAFRDSGSMSVLEASALGCPTVCFDAGGQDAFPENALLKVNISKSYNEVLQCFADKLLWAFRNQRRSKEIGIKAQKYVYENMTWKKKVIVFDNIYQAMI